MRKISIAHEQDNNLNYAAMLSGLSMVGECVTDDSVSSIKDYCAKAQAYIVTPSRLRRLGRSKHLASQTR